MLEISEENASEIISPVSSAQYRHSSPTVIQYLDGERGSSLRNGLILIPMETFTREGSGD